MENLPQAYVIGAGSIGLYIQYILQKQLNCVLLARQHTYQKLKSSPLTLTGAVEDSILVNCVPIDDVNKFSSNAPIFIVTKSHEALPLVNLISHKLSPNNPLILCQNGIGIYEEAQNLKLPNPIFRLSCWMGIQRLDFDRIHIAGTFKFDLASESYHLDIAKYWQQALEKSGIQTSISDSPQKSEWQKALWNIAVNGICSIMNMQNGIILDSLELKHIAQNLISESIYIASLDGVILTEDDAQGVFQSLEKTRHNVNATLQDLRAGRKTEVDFLNGAVVKTALRHNKTAPFNEVILSMISYLEKSGQRKI